MSCCFHYNSSKIETYPQAQVKPQGKMKVFWPLGLFVIFLLLVHFEATI